MYVIADSHIHDDQSLRIFVNDVNKLAKEDTVILLGDIFDFTKIPISELKYSTDMFSDNVIYVKGNHDIIADELNIPCVEKYISDNGIIFEHGHRFEAISKSNFITTPESYENLFRRLCYSKSSVQSIANNFWKLYCKMILNRQNKYELAKSMLEQMSKEKNMICGHAHYYLCDSVSNCVVVDAYVGSRTIYRINETEFFKEGKSGVYKI